MELLLTNIILIVVEGIILCGRGLKQGNKIFLFLGV